MDDDLRADLVPVVADKAGALVLAGVDRAVTSRWERAVQVAAATSGTREERVAQVKRTFAREMGVVGAAAGAAAAAPGVGTIAAFGTASVELGVFTTRAADLILTVAAIHGHTEAGVEQRRAWILAVLAFGNTAAPAFTRVAGELGKGLGSRATRSVSTTALLSINRALGRTIVTRYGSRRGAVALGRALPFGIGAAIGGSANYGLARVIARQADSFFRDLPPSLGGRPALDP